MRDVPGPQALLIDTLQDWKTDHYKARVTTEFAPPAQHATSRVAQDLLSAIPSDPLRARNGSFRCRVRDTRVSYAAACPLAARTHDRI